MKSIGYKAFLTAIAAGAAYEAYEHAVLARRSYTVSVPEALAGLKLLLLSDLHCNPFVCNNKHILAKIEAEKPDVILLAGDMFSKYGKPENERVPFFLISLTKIAPVIACLGNHEQVLKQQFPDQYALFHARLSRFGVYLLENETLTLMLHGKKVTFCGFSIDLKYYFLKRKRAHLSAAELSKLPRFDTDRTILLAHHPDYFDEYCKLSPLVVSGHVHGGIMNLPFFGGVLSPQLYKPPYSHGCYKKEGATLVVSSGAGSHSIPVRFFNRIEYCIIHTIPREKE